MPRKILATLTMSAMIMGSVAPMAYASPSLTVQATAQVVKGGAVTINGTANLTDVIVKVVGPNQLNLFYDTQKVTNGAFQDSFTIPVNDQNWPLGVYTVSIGQGTNVQTTTFQLIETSTPPSTGGGGGGGTPSTTPTAPTLPVSPTYSSGASITDISGAIDVKVDANGVAQVTLDNTKTIAAIQNAKADSKTFVVALPQTSGSNSFSVTLSTEILNALSAKGGSEASIVVISPFGDYNLPLHALGSQSKSTIVVTIGQAKAPIPQQVQTSATAQGLTVVGTPVTFTVESVDANGTKKEIESFSNVYVARSVHVGSTVDTAHSVVVKVNADGSLIPVPTFFTKDATGYAAVINRTSNSSYAVVTGSKSFSDVKGFWAEASISKMASHLLVNGMTDTTFEPQAKMTRAQFTSLMVRALGLSDGEGTNKFADVASTDWFYKDVNIAVGAGLIDGYGDKFGPDDNITREQMAVIITRALKFAGKTEETASKALKFADAGDISSWALPSISKAVQAGILEGDAEGLLRPGSLSTRAEGTVMLERMLKSLQFIN
ncbi:S-layer homology domain-containing protein [Paenibacillus sp. SI8]|uniref:S-layer homology domain-containing protein n=1 Tax=unclassified Paenibacillus TaxID=185978 RepID=UPI0034655BC4